MGVVKNLFFFINSPVGTMWWDYLCRRIALQMPSEGAFSIFYRGCKQSNLSTQPFWPIILLQRYAVSVAFLAFDAIFFRQKSFFNYLSPSKVRQGVALYCSPWWGGWLLRLFLPVVATQRDACASRGVELSAFCR